MPYAIVQKSLDPPSVEQLRRAFRALPSLTDADAAIMLRDAFGILVERLELADAGRLLQALAAEGVAAEMVDQKSLPPLPPPRPLHRAECSAEAFVAYDHLGRAQPIEWPHVILIAAGAVALTEFKRIVEEKIVYRHTDGRGGSMPTVDIEQKDKEERNVRLILELFLDAAPGRFRIAAHEFSFAYLGDRLHPRGEQNYLSLVQDCLAGASGAVLNRGAQKVGEGAAAPFEYPTKHAFEEETIWLLWRHFGSGRDLG